MRSELFAVALFLSVPLGCSSREGASSNPDGGEPAVCASACAPVTLAEEQPGLYAIAVGGGSVFWSNATPTADAIPPDGSVKTVPLAGGTPMGFVGPFKLPISLALDATHVYWKEAFYGGVYSEPLAGGSPSKLASFGGKGPAMAVDGTRVYFDDYDQGAVVLMSVPVGGGDKTQLATTQSMVGAIAVQGGSVYWTDLDERACGARLMKVPASGGDATVLYSGGGCNSMGLGALVVDATRAYWTTTGGGGALMRTPIAGGETTTMTIASGILKGPIAIDPTSVYWSEATGDDTNYYDDKIMQAPLAGGAATAVAEHQGLVRGLAASADGVCWLNFMDRTVVRLGVCRDGTCE